MAVSKRVRKPTAKKTQASAPQRARATQGQASPSPAKASTPARTARASGSAPAASADIDDAITIAYIIELGGDPFLNKIKSPKTFNFEEFGTAVYKAVEERVDGAELSSAYAFMSCQNPAICKRIDFETPDDYEEALRLARSWVREKKKSVTMDIKYEFVDPAAVAAAEAAAAEAVEAEAEAATAAAAEAARKRAFEEFLSSSESGSDSEEVVVPKKAAKKARKTTSWKAKQRNAEDRADETAAAASRSDIMVVNNCDLNGCRGYDRSCWQPDGRLGQHYTLSNDDLRKWLKAMAVGKATIKSPPASMQETLKARRQLQVEASARKASTPAPATPAPVTPAPATPAPAPAAENPMLAGLTTLLPAIQCFGEVLKLFRPPEQPTLPAYHPREAYVPGNIRPASRERQSSPVRIDSMQADHLYTYFQWAKERYPAQAAPLDAAFHRASNEELTLDVIAEMKSAVDWKSIEIPFGIGSRLRGGVKAFLRDLDKGWTPRPRVEERRQTGAARQASEQESSVHTALNALVDAANMAQ